ncbi:MAG: hypothetical protein V3T83_19705 [Acidobacteriota bacterium]
MQDGQGFVVALGDGQSDGLLRFVFLEEGRDGQEEKNGDQKLGRNEAVKKSPRKTKSNAPSAGF